MKITNLERAIEIAKEIRRLKNDISAIEDGRTNGVTFGHYMKEDIVELLRRHLARFESEVTEL